jgi:hypothetical protein
MSPERKNWEPLDQQVAELAPHVAKTWHLKLPDTVDFSEPVVDLDLDWSFVARQRIHP